MMPNTSFAPFSDVSLLHCTNDYNNYNDYRSFHKHMPGRDLFSFSGITESVGLVEVTVRIRVGLRSGLGISACFLDPFLL